MAPSSPVSCSLCHVGDDDNIIVMCRWQEGVGGGTGTMASGWYWWPRYVPHGALVPFLLTFFSASSFVLNRFES